MKNWWTLPVMAVCLCTQLYASPCITQPMIDLAGTSCTIGDVTFDFGGFNSDFRFVPASGVTVSFLESKPTAVAFTLSDNFGISVPQDGDIHIDTSFGLSYSAQITQPDLGFSGLGVAVSDIMMSAPPASGGTRFSLTHCFQAFCPLVYEQESGGAFESSNGGTSFSSALQGTVAIPDVILGNGTPSYLTSGIGLVSGNMLVDAAAGGPSASVSFSSTTMSLRLAPPSPVPEPGSASLMILGIIGLLGLSLHSAGVSET